MNHISQYKFYHIALCFFLGTMVSISQNQNIEWSAESFLIVANGTEVELTSNLTKQGTTFTWEQVGYNTTDTSTYTITATSGNWNTQDNIGELNYDLTLEELSANLTISGTEEGVIAILHINSADASGHDTYTFYIETLTSL